MTTVRDVARTQTLHAIDALPDAVFTEGAAPWQTTVLGHLKAARTGIAADGGTAITQALDAARRLLGA